MKTITVRGLEPVLLDQIRQTAKKESKSMNQLLLEIIKKHIGVNKEKKYTRTYDDLDHLFGRWSEDEFETVQGNIDAERKIDPEIWQ